jgi:2-polyprenyl-3-methyl-5-hydroxy-6-metoxy-1,4-benzoquinol methylase
MALNSHPDTTHWPKTPEEVERLNDQLASEHPIDDYYERSPWFIRQIQAHRLSLIKQMTASRPGATILEVGSGGGHVLRMFPEAKLTAADVSQRYLDTARRNLEGYDVTFIKGQIERLALPAASFDRIICTEVLEHTTNPGEILAELHRLLTPDGIAVVTVPIDPVIDRAKQLIKLTPIGWILGDRVQWGGDHYHLQKWWPSQFQRLLEEKFIVTQRRLAPARLLPLHACFACRRC